nr:FAD-binding and (Fe-S)-binding domain-containing protein [Psychromicrobium sp. YIM S02556]
MDITQAPDRALASSLVARLATAGIIAETSARRLAEYSYDASNYRVPPLAVVFPRSVHDVVATVEACRESGTPLIGRGGGTSMAGNAVGPGVILDFSRHLNGILEIDEPGQSVLVEPGVVLAQLSQAVERATDQRLTFAPDPSSRTRATVGGALGNDACGNHSVRYGRTSDHVIELQLVTSDGTRLTATATGLHATEPSDEASAARARELSEELKDLAKSHLAEFRLELDRFQRQVSGYHLANLLPERRFNVARALVGSEGTCAIIVAARMRLVPRPPSALLICLGYSDVVEAARDIETILEFSPAAVEGIDEAIVETMRFRRGASSVATLPAGRAWLYVDLDGADPASVQAQAALLLQRLQDNGRLIEGRLVPDAAERASLWRVREDGAGLSSRLAPSSQLSPDSPLAGGGESWPGWEDSAVEPARLADYLADFRELLARYQLQGVMYGHFGAGCMHIRITYDLRSKAGRAVFRTFTRDAAELVVRHGGSLSGEHGDGRARSEFLPLMYSPRLLAAFARFRQLWDQHGILNPGSVVDPDPLDAHLALDGVPDRQWRTSFELRSLGSAVPEASHARVDPWVNALQSCIGVGRCRTAEGGVMCPSYRATRDEKDSTRGRARVLQEMVRGARTVEEGWKSEEVREALDLCLSCKACATDCPTGVDMASYKSEFFSHYYQGRLRPLSHYALGWLPRWLKLTGRIAPLVNAVMASPLAPVIAAAGGLSRHRVLPRFASDREWRREVAGAGVVEAGQREADGVVLFVDTFTRGFRPEVAGAAARVLASTGTPVQCSEDACCALSWISTGQLSTAIPILQRTAAALDDGPVDGGAGRPIVVLEPSCAAALRKDLPELVGTDQARRVAARVRSFAAHLQELLREGWTPQPAQPLPEQVVLQTHCHEYSAFGPDTQHAALRSLGIHQVHDATGCCGVAGNFGFEKEHFEVSMQVAEQALAPALREHPEAVLLTDGFSCSIQAQQLDAARAGQHLAQLLDPGPA